MGGQRREAGASKGLRSTGGGRSGEGDLDKRAMTAGEEDEQASQGGDWATSLLSRLLLLGFEIYVKYDKSTVIK